MVYSENTAIVSMAFDSIYEITDHLRMIVSKSGIKTGMINVFHTGSTASITGNFIQPIAIDPRSPVLILTHSFRS